MVLGKYHLVALTFLYIWEHCSYIVQCWWRNPWSKSPSSMSLNLSINYSTSSNLHSSSSLWKWMHHHLGTHVPQDYCILIYVLLHTYNSPFTKRLFALTQCCYFCSCSHKMRRGKKLIDLIDRLKQLTLKNSITSRRVKGEACISISFEVWSIKSINFLLSMHLRIL